MSASFANIQIRPTAGESAGRESVVEAAGALLSDQEGWERVDDPDRADRSVRVGPRHGDGWVGVYLDRADRFEEVESFGVALSEDLETDGIGLRAAGGEFDAVPVHSGRAGGRFSGLDADSPGDLWSGWIDENRSEEFRALLADRDGPADEVAGRLADLLGMDPELAAAGSRFVELNVAGDVDTLHFRRVDAEPAIERVTGPPRFEIPDRVRDLRASVGESVQVSTSVGNRGGELTGLRIRVGGTAVDRELVEIETIRVSGGAGQETLEAAGRVEEDGGRRVVAADFEHLTVAGALSGDVDLSDLSDERGREVMRAHRASRVAVSAHGRAVREGDGELFVELSGTNASGRERGRAESRLTVHPEPRLPAGARPEDAPTHTLRQMERSDTLFALLHFDRPIGAWRSLASDALSRWAREIAAPGDRFVTVRLSDPRSRPDEQIEASEAFTDSERMADRIGEFDGLYQWSAVLHPGRLDDERMEPESTGGFSYFSCGGPESDAETEPSPAVGFWISVADRSDEETRRFRSKLRELVDEFARSGRLLQGLLARWGWAPALSIRTLPYEIVCGLDSAGHLRTDWLDRYLRAATSELWLGRTLLGRLDRERLDDVADVVELGEAGHLTLRAGVEMEEFEEVLRPVLPGPEAWAEESG